MNNIRTEIRSQLELLVTAKNEQDALDKIKPVKLQKFKDFTVYLVSGDLFKVGLVETGTNLKPYSLERKQINDLVDIGAFFTDYPYSNDKSQEIYSDYSNLENELRSLIIMALSSMPQVEQDSLIRKIVDVLNEHRSNKKKIDHSTASLSSIIYELTFGDAINFAKSSNKATGKKNWDAMRVFLKKEPGIKALAENFDKVKCGRNLVAHSKPVGHDDYDDFKKAYNGLAPVFLLDNYNTEDEKLKQQLAKDLVLEFEQFVKECQLPPFLDSTMRESDEKNRR